MELLGWRIALTLTVERAGNREEAVLHRLLEQSRQQQEQTRALLSELGRRTGDPEAFAKLLATVDFNAPLTDDTEPEGAEDYGP